MRRAILISAGLILATIAAYWPVRLAEFINFDDPTYVTSNPMVFQGLNAGAIAWAFTTVHGSNWHPLTWLSHMLDCQIFGDHAAGHHGVNVGFHAVNAVLLFLLLWRMTGAEWRSAFVAALFALHPLHVESVAWVSERKDVLSTFFGLLALLAYGRYAQGRRLRVNYVLAVAFYALSLLSKPMLVTLPFVLLLLDYWPLGRLRVKRSKDRVAGPPLPPLRRVLLEKAPFLALAIASSVVTFFAQHKGGSVVTIATMPPLYRAANAVVSYGTYLEKMFWPAKLSVFYPFARELSSSKALVCLAMLLVVTAVTILCARRAPYFLVGWLWYLGTLIPVIGVVQVGTQAMADRYTYVPLMGIFIALTWGIADLTARRSWRGFVLAPGAAIILGACIVATRTEAGYWHDSVTLFTRALALTEHNALAEHNLAHALSTTGRQEESLAHFDNALRYWPGYTVAMLNRGNALNLMGRLDDAIAQYREAIQVRPDFEQAYYYLGNALALQLKFDEAKTNLLMALKCMPDYPEAHLKLGNLLALQGDVSGAEQHLRVAVELQPDAESCYFLGGVLARQKKFTEAVECFRAAIKSSPKYAAAQNDLAWILATSTDPKIRNPSEAIALATRACGATQDGSAGYLDTLGVAYSEARQFPQAIAITEKAVALVPGDTAFAAEMQSRLALYRAGRSYSERVQPPH